MKTLTLLMLLLIAAPAGADQTFIVDHGFFGADTCDDEGACSHPMQGALTLSGPDFSITTTIFIDRLEVLDLGNAAHLVDPATVTYDLQGGPQPVRVAFGTWTFAEGTLHLVDGLNQSLGTVMVVTNGMWSGTATLIPVIDSLAPCCIVAFNAITVRYQLTPFEAPEPATWVLLGSGLIGMMWWKRKRTV